MSDMKKFFVGVKGIIIDDEKGILLLRAANNRGSHWDIPGGRINGNEDFIQTLTREFAEELPGTEIVKVGELLGSIRIHQDVAPETGLVLLYLAVTVKLPEPLKLSDEHTGYEWINDQSKIPEGINPELRRILHYSLSE